MDIKFNITEHIDTISSNPTGEFTLELNLVSWNDRQPRLDLRRWHNEIGTDKKTPQKGLTLNDWELMALRTVIDEKCQ